MAENATDVVFMFMVVFSLRLRGSFLPQLWPAVGSGHCKSYNLLLTNIIVKAHMLMALPPMYEQAATELI